MTGPRQQKWFWLLVASLGANIFFAGFSVSRCTRAKHFDGRARHHAEAPLGFRVKEALGDSASDETRQLLRQQRTTIRAQRQKLRQARSQVRRALEAEPFDAAELERQLTELRSASLATQESLHEGLVKLAGTLTVEQRKRLAEANWNRRRAKRHPPRD